MHGAAVTLAKRFLENGSACDMVLADSMLDLSTFLALTRRKTASLPIALYMHENQLTYPLPSDPNTGAMRRNRNERDHHYVFINYVSMLAADRIFFNSAFHLDSWFSALPRYLKHYPDFRNMDTVASLRERSVVLPVGIRPPIRMAKQDNGLPPLILWNQRWEYDKQPEQFFAALSSLKERGIAFRLAVCGENFSRKPTVFDEAQVQFADELVHIGFAERAQYVKLLNSAEIVVSTAIHEFFGISILEAILHGAVPILPNRLAYPELIPPSLHANVLYETETELVDKLVLAVNNTLIDSTERLKLLNSAEKYTWPNIIVNYDQQLAKLVA